MSETPTPLREEFGPLWLWLVWLLSMVLGGVLWWAIGGSASFESDAYGPAHYLQQGCDSGGTDGLYFLAALLLAGAGIAFLVMAVRRWQWFFGVGLWAGLFLMFDGFLMFWYFLLMGMTRGCD